MTDYYADVDEARRVHALDEALRNLDVDATTNDVLARAGRFEAYLKGEVELTFDPIQVSAELKVEAAPESLPKVSHYLVGGDDNCLGCEWNILAKRAGHHTDEPLPKPPSHEMKQLDGALRCLACDWIKLMEKTEKAEAGE